MNHPVDKSTRDSDSPVANAIRLKQGPKTSVANDLEALEASLLADIEKFDLCAASRLADPPPVDADLRNIFPEIIPGGTVRSLGPARAVKPELSEAAEPEEGGSCDLLQQLRQQAEVRRQDDAQRQQELCTANREIDLALRRVFKYCHDLVQQLNVLKPGIDQHYALPGHLEFAGLQWQEGFVDYRTHSISTGSAYELVTLSCRLAAPGSKLRAERDAIQAEPFRRALFDNGIAFTCDEIRNARQMVEKAVFTLNAEVKLNVRWQAMPEKGGLLFESRNLERFGSRSHMLRASAVDAPLLDQFARLLLGKPNRFRDYYNR